MIMLQYSGILFMTHKAFKSCTSIYVHFILCPTEHHVPNYIELPKSNYDNNRGSTLFARFHIYVNREIDRQYMCVYMYIYDYFGNIFILWNAYSTFRNIWQNFVQKFLLIAVVSEISPSERFKQVDHLPLFHISLINCGQGFCLIMIL